jgi:hypothetical protein
MKNRINVLGALCALLFTASLAHAQDEDEEDRRENIEFGAKAGVNISNVWDDRDEQFQADPKLGFAGGVFVGIPIGKFIGIQPEILISQKGFKGSGQLLGTPYSFTRTTLFLDVPLQLQLKPAKFLTFLVGPQFSYLINKKDKYSFGSNSTAQQEDFDNEDIRKNILGLLAGFDVMYENFVFSGRAALDLQTNRGDGTSTTPRYKNQWLQFTVGFKI